MGGVVVVVVVEHGRKGVIPKRITAEGISAPKEGAEDVKGVHVGLVGLTPVVGWAAPSTVPPGSSLAQPLLPEPVICRSLVGVAQHFIGLSNLLEPLLGVRLLVLVRVELEGHLPVGLLDLLLPSPFLHPQHPVVVLPHGGSLCHSLISQAAVSRHLGTFSASKGSFLAAAPVALSSG